MIDLYFWTTPNGYKPLLFLEEAQLSYRLIPVNIHRGDQFRDEFSRISPNQRIPAIVDNDPSTGPSAAYLNKNETPISLFESGAILHYLAEKTGRFFPADNAGRAEVMQWLFWQMGGLGPMLGQNFHFSVSSAEKIPYALDRYVNESRRLFGVLNERLANRQYIATDYSIADMACYPWIIEHPHLSVDIEDYPHVQAWQARVEARPATQRAYAAGVKINAPSTTDTENQIALPPVRGVESGTVHQRAEA